MKTQLLILPILFALYYSGAAWAKESDSKNAAPNHTIEVVESASTTSTGVPLDTLWKRELYQYAKTNVVHPSWGLSHSERDYRNSVNLAERENLEVDKDVLLAAAFLHDLGGIGSFQKPHVDHGVRSAELAEPLLKSWGFPMEKWSKVKETIIGHMYYGPAPSGPEAIVFHDADCLDFLGSMGVARLFAACNDPDLGTEPPSLSVPAKTLATFAKDMPSKLVTKSAQADAVARIAEMNDFLQKLSTYTFDGKAF